MTNSGVAVGKKTAPRGKCETRSKNKIGVKDNGTKEIQASKKERKQERKHTRKTTDFRRLTALHTLREGRRTKIRTKNKDTYSATTNANIHSGKPKRNW